MVDHLPEECGRLGIRLIADAEHERHGRVAVPGAGDAHAEIGDHVTEMTTDRTAPDAAFGGFGLCAGRLRARVDGARDPPPAVARVELRSEVRPVRAAAKQRATGE